MQIQSFKSQDDISDDWLLYVSNQAFAVSKFDDFEIDNYADREILSPNMQALLESLVVLDTDTKDNNTISLTLSFAESRAAAYSLWGNRFRRLKNKIREILCKIVSALAGDGDLNWKDIIKAVLIALIPALGGGPLSLAVLPILISLIAKLVKRGLDAVCPVNI